MDVEKYLQLHGMNIFIRMIGEGEPIVFLHGGPGAEHRTFLPHALPLAENFTLVFYDQRGCGNSERATNPSAYTIEDEIETLEELRVQLNIGRLNLVGESWGTMLALLYAARYPDHVNKMLLASSVGPSHETYEQFSTELQRRMTSEDTRKLEEVSARLERGEGELDEIFEILDPYYVHSLDTLTRNTKTIKNVEVNGTMHPQIMARYDIRPHFNKLQQIPIRFLQGESDLISPQTIKDVLVSQLPNATLRAVGECGHWVYVEQDKLFNDEVTQFFA